MLKMDATYGNMLNVLRNALADIKETQKKAKDALDATNDAELLVNQVIELLKIRRKEN